MVTCKLAVYAGRAPRVTFYRNVGNQGLQFSAVAGWVYELARKKGIGREIPTDWFVQDIRDWEPG